MTAESSRIVFMGTPDFAVPVLHALIHTPQYAVVGVVTQPDRPAGRGQKLQMSPVKETALAAAIPVIQPDSLRRESDAVAQIKAWQPDFLVVAAFGQILRQDVLDIPRVAPINVHASLLPRWRGAAPIQAAIREGDAYTGITTMIMDAGLDTGPILLQDSIPIDADETGQSLHDKLAPLGAQLLIHTLNWLLAGSIEPHPQPTNAALIMIAPTLKKEDGAIRWTENAVQIDRQVRAYTPWPGTFTTWNGKRLKIIEGYPMKVRGAALAEPGEVRDVRGTPYEITTPLAIGTGNGLYAPTRLQLAGRQAVDAAAFLNGAPEFLGSRLG